MQSKAKQNHLQAYVTKQQAHVIFKTSDWVLHFKVFTERGVVIPPRSVFYSRSCFWVLGSWFFRALPVATWIPLCQPGIVLFVIFYEWADLQNLWVSQPFTGGPIDFPKFPFVNVIFLVFIIVGQCFHDLKDTLLIKRFTLHGSRIKSHQSLPPH